MPLSCLNLSWLDLICDSVCHAGLLFPDDTCDRALLGLSCGGLCPYAISSCFSSSGVLACFELCVPKRFDPESAEAFSLLTVPNFMPSETATLVWFVQSAVTTRRKEGIHAVIMLNFITTWVRIQGFILDHVWSNRASKY